jgi:polysaccharide export outer membrane protein
VRFPGAVYEREVVDALRFHARLYVHGHTVGGTNPALVEALGAGVPVLARDNVYNRWVAGDAACFFSDEAACAAELARLLDPAADERLAHMRGAAYARHASTFTLSRSLEQNEEVLQRSARTHAEKPRRAAFRSAAALGIAAALCAGLLSACGGGVLNREIRSLPPLTVLPGDLEASAQRLTAGDVVTVTYPYRPDFSRDLVVRPDGRITLPYIGAIEAGGRTPEQLRLEIQRAYARRAYAPTDQSADRHYLINVGDELEIRFREAKELNTTVRVRPDGRISLALVKSVMAEGLTPEQLEADLIKRYRGELSNPDLVVVVKEFTSDRVYVNGQLMRPGIKDLDEADVGVKSFVARQVYVAGEVLRPGLVPYQPGLSALQAIATAGGTPRSAKMNNVLVLRRTTADSGRAIFVNLADDIKARSTNDVLLQPFDVIVVPKTGVTRVSDFLDQYLYQLLPITRNSNFSFFYDLSRSGARIP